MTRPPAPIQALSDQLINQIAAGEVIERPVSVVKELVENSLDAGARSVSVEVGAGGIETIVVGDDGSGIPGAELGAACRRHWTSKISASADLDAIVSLGFRGEALASICAVADVSIVTRTEKAPHAWQFVHNQTGESSAPRPAQGNKGTRIEVRRLFHNVPARKRFLKQARTEYLHIYRLIRQLAFARPDVSFALSHDGKRTLQLPAGAYEFPSGRWRSLFGKAFYEGAHAIAREINGVCVRGWVAGAELATNLADTQMLCLNGRVIRDKQLQHAVRLAYEASIADGRFACYALALDIDPTQVDVNVDPGKLEVRFVDIRTLHDILHVCVKAALHGSETVSSPEDKPAFGPVAEPAAHYVANVGRTTAVSAPPRRAATAGSPSDSYGKVLAVVGNRYLLCESDTSLRVLDISAAWRAILPARLGPAASQSRPLLLPERLPTSAAGRALLSNQHLSALGFDFADLGAAGGILRAVPRRLPSVDQARFVAALSLARLELETSVVGVADAAASSLVLSRHDHTARNGLDELVRSAAAIDFDLETCTLELSDARLARLFAHAG